MVLIQDIDLLCADIVDRGVIAGFDARGEDALSNVGVFSKHFLCWFKCTLDNLLAYT